MHGIDFECKRDLKWKEVQEHINIRGGKDHKLLDTGAVPVFGSGGMIEGLGVCKSAYNKPTVLLPRKGSVENVFYVDMPFWNIDTIFYTEIDETIIIPKFFYYLMSNKHIEQYSESSTRPSLTRTKLNKINIPIPPLSIQQLIVDTLDQFSTLTEDITDGLPKELELHRKQYEYYRKELLTFPANEKKTE